MSAPPIAAATDAWSFASATASASSSSPTRAPIRSAVASERPTSSNSPDATDHVLTTSRSSGSRTEQYATPKSHSIRRTLRP